MSDLVSIAEDLRCPYYSTMSENRMDRPCVISSFQKANLLRMAGANSQILYVPLFSHY